LCNKINEHTGLNIDTHEIYYLILNNLKMDIEKIERASLEQFYEETEALFFKYKPVRLFPSIRRLFDEVRSENKTMNILSNTGFITGRTLKKLIVEYGFDKYFIFQIYSDEVGFSKPNFKIFQLLYDRVKEQKSLKSE